MTKKNTSKLILPALINPPRLRKDGSASLNFETRELTPEEYMTVMGFRNTEGWLCFVPNEDEKEIAFLVPETKAEVDSKTPSERLRNVMYVWFKQESEAGRYVGTFEAFRAERMEKIIEWIKNKLN